MPHKAKLIIANPAHDPNIYWSTGYWTTDPVTYLEMPKGERVLFVTSFEVDQARSKVKKGITVMPDKGMASLEKTLASHRITTIVIPETFPSRAYQHLTKARYAFEIVPTLFPERIKKSNKEIVHIRQCQRAAENAFSAAITLIANARVKNKLVHYGKKPITSEGVRSHILQYLITRGYACPLDIIVASGRQSFHPHYHGSGPLQANAPIVIDIFPQSLTTHYWGDFTRTVVKGRASDALRKMYNAVRAAHEVAIEKVRAGVSFKTLDAFVRDFFKKNGFAASRTEKVGFTHSLGHRVGLEIHEGPSLFTGRPRLQMGDTITIEPGLYYPDIGGVRIEDLVAVTKEGYINLTNVPTKLLEI